MANQRKYVCSFCSKAFSRSEHRARHERSHTGLKPFECKVCRHAFVRRDLLQRHIRTVHRELLLVRKDARERESELQGKGKEGTDAAAGNETGGSNSGSRSDLVVELLVNSMIHVTKKEPSGLRGERAEVLARLVGGFLPDAAPCPESVGRMFDAGLSCVEKRLQELSPQVQNAVAPQAHVFNQLCTASPLVLAITALGACAANQRLGSDLWRASWSSCLKTSAAERFLSLHVLVLAVLEYKVKANYADVFSVYQHTCYAVLPSREAPEKWTVFHYWVTLMRFAETQNEVTPLLYDWFEQQEVYLGRTLGEALKKPEAATDTLADAVFCQWILGRPTCVREVVDLYARATRGATIVSESHWLLLETAWFAFVKQLEHSGFYTSCRIAWFRNCLVKDLHAEVDGDAIDDLLLRVILTVLVALDREVMDPRCVALVADVTLFLLRVCPGSSSGSGPAQENPTLTKLFYLLQKRAGTEGVSSYLRGTALFLANLPTTDSELRVHLMVAVQGSPQGEHESPSPVWLLSPASTCSVVDDKPRRARSHSGSSIVLPPLQVRPFTSGPGAYAYGHADVAPVAAPFASSPTLDTHRTFSVRLPPPSELFQASHEP
ncbi:uncharacterized protein ZBAI_02568 [Zygosaccharomyces bailii ISA1307]|nr:uncharacterized protein ZBAI_02568 [Zygosaccharomyces bailii ISA1307]